MTMTLYEYTNKCTKKLQIYKILYEAKHLALFNSHNMVT